MPKRRRRRTTIATFGNNQINRKIDSSLNPFPLMKRDSQSSFPALTINQHHLDHHHPLYDPHLEVKVAAMSTFFGLKAKPYPFDPASPGSTPWDTLSAPYPRYPNDDNLFRKAFPPNVYRVTLSPWLPLGFSLAYYIVAHAANGIVKRNGNKDYTKAPGLQAKILRFLILIHNAGLALYSGWTWAMMFPYVVDFFSQGWRAAGFDGVKLALCSMPTNCPHLGKYAYIFYLSKYYEVFDSVILLLKGKKVSNLQSYHHAGAIICMWIAYRYQSQPVWGKFFVHFPSRTLIRQSITDMTFAFAFACVVFCVFNSLVHTCMYTYYFCAAMRWPFPRAVKRNLTTMQIAQIASGTFLTNLYLLIKLNPNAVVNGYKANKVSSWFQPVATRDESLFIHALGRAASTHPTTCMQTTGAEIALHVNTMYMFVSIAISHIVADRCSSTDSLSTSSCLATTAPPCALLQLLHALLSSKDP